MANSLRIGHHGISHGKLQGIISALKIIGLWIGFSLFSLSLEIFQLNLGQSIVVIGCQITGIEIISWLGDVGNHIVGGFFGAAAGAFGAFVSSTLTGWTVGSGDAIAYRNRLNAGKYLIIAKGSDAFMREATQLLRQYEPENLQGYVETARA